MKSNFKIGVCLRISGALCVCNPLIKGNKMKEVFEKLLIMTDTELLLLSKDELEKLQDDYSNLLSEYTGMQFYYYPDPMPIEILQEERQIQEQYNRIYKILLQVQQREQ